MRTVAILTALLLAVLPVWSGAADVSIVLSETGTAYQEAVQAAELHLSALAKTTVVPAEGLARAPKADPSVIITVGTRAFHAVLANGTRAPVIATLIPRAAYELELKALPRSAFAPPSTAVFLDQPIARQLNLVRTLVPTKTRIGLLLSPATENMLPRIERPARERKLSVAHEVVSDPRQISTALSRLLGESELLLAVPDPLIYNAGTIHNILLSALRARQPLIGFSDAYVRAGALAAVYSKPQQVGAQAAEIAARTIAGIPLPSPQDPRAFTVRVNEILARSLGLQIESEETIAGKLQLLEPER